MVTPEELSEFMHETLRKLAPYHGFHATRPLIWRNYNGKA